MKIVCISDTHGHHEKLRLPEGDLIIHAGDISSRGLRSEISEFLSWFDALDFKYKLFIAGNHDYYFEDEMQIVIEDLIPNGIIYLNDSGIEIEDLQFWGSPVQPWFYNWAFNRHRGSDILEHWNLIPQETDILITHGPAAGKLDVTTRGEHVGCADLLDTIERIKPKYHICGHIHEAYGLSIEPDTTYINCSILNEYYQMENCPIIVTL